MANENFEIGSTLESESFGGNFIVPVGTIMMFAGPITQTSSAGVITTTAPDGWLLCNGQTFIQANYPILYDFLNSTTLPDMTNSYLKGAEFLPPEGGFNTPAFQDGALSVTQKTNSNSHTHNLTHTIPNTYSNVYLTNYLVQHIGAGHVHGVGYPNGYVGAYTGHNHIWNYASRTTAYATNYGNFVGGPQGFVAVNGHIHDTFTARSNRYNEQFHDHSVTAVNYGNVAHRHEHYNFTQTSATFGANNTPKPLTYYINFIVKAR
jgi:hypothetical protein